MVIVLSSLLALVRALKHVLVVVGQHSLAHQVLRWFVLLEGEY